MPVGAAPAVDELLELTGIPAAARKRAGEYSMGMRQRLGLAAALLGDPKVLVLDEPSNGLDPEGIRWLRGFLRHLSSEGKTILVSSHLLQEVEQTVDEVVIIANGRLVRAGAMAELHGTPGAVVRTSDPARLAGALRVADVTSTPGPRTARSWPTPPTCGSWATSPCGPACRSTVSSPAVPTSRRSSSSSPRAPTATRPSGAVPPSERDAVAGQEGANLMIPAIRSEFRKFFTTRLWWGMAIAIFLVRRRPSPPSSASSSPLDQAARGPGGIPIGDATQIANSVYTGAWRRLPAPAHHRGAPDRLGVPAQDDLGTFLATPRGLQAMVAKVVASWASGALYGLISLVGSVSVGAVVLAARPGRVPLLRDHRAHAGAEPARPRPVGAHRAGHRHPHPQPGGGPAHRGRRRVDRRAAARLSMTFWEFGRENIAQFLPSSATNRGHRHGAEQPGRGAARVVGRPLVLAAYAALLAGFGIWRTTRADIT